MDDPKVTIGGREFSIPEYSIKEQRRVTPALSRLAKKASEVESDAMWDEMMDTIFLCLTIGGANVITKDEFEGLKVKSMEMVSTVLPVLFVAAGLQPAKAATTGGAGAAEPETPLSGGTTSTTESQI